ncbi:hypothetical protein Mapa_013670 [Marchantia paleacea]|nr:hypothetical protein Mapa_013670 [Marchantia paleacea]
MSTTAAEFRGFEVKKYKEFYHSFIMDNGRNFHSGSRLYTLLLVAALLPCMPAYSAPAGGGRFNTILNVLSLASDAASITNKLTQASSSTSAASCNACKWEWVAYYNPYSSATDAAKAQCLNNLATAMQDQGPFTEDIYYYLIGDPVPLCYYILKCSVLNNTEVQCSASSSNQVKIWSSVSAVFVYLLVSYL